MRNLKRVLSLSLALVMMLGMMVIGASAAEATTVDFADADEITNTEAVDVMVALGIIEGDGTNFNPTDILTREQAAKIICYMLMGPANAEKLSKNTTIFKDVAAGRWSAGYIAYCANLGIIAGMGDGTFDPEGELTGVAFGKMLLVALGYDAEIEGYVGNNWATNIATDMIAADIDVDGVSLDAPLSRDNACQMAFNTLTANTVSYSTKTEVNTGNATVTVSGGRSDVTRTGTDYRGISEAAGDGYQQFCEKYFPNLKVAATTDGMARYAHEWLLKKDSIGVYTETPDYSTYVTWKNFNLTKVIDALSTKFKESSADVYVNGLEVADYEVLYNGGAAYTGNRGDLVEIYMDEDDMNRVDRIVITHTTVVELTGPAVLTETSNATYIDIPGVVTAGLANYVHGYEDLARGDVIMYYTDAENHTFIQVADSVVGTMTETTENDKADSVSAPATYTVDGTIYRASYQTGANAMTGGLVAFEGQSDVTYYLDNAGHIIYAVGQPVPVELMLILKNYDYATGDSVFETGKEKSQVLFVNEDATTEIVKITSIDGYNNMAANVSDNNTYSLDDDTVWTANASYATARLFSYEKTVKGYDLETVSTIRSTSDIVTGLPTYHVGGYQDSSWTSNSDTVYLVRNYNTNRAAYEDTFTAYVGYENVPTITGAVCLTYAVRGVAKYIVVTSYSTIANTADDLFYAISNNVTAVYKSDNSGAVAYWYITGIYNGEIVNLKLNATAAAAVGTNFTNKLFSITKYDSNGYVDTISRLSTGTKYWDSMTGTKAASSNVLLLDTAGSTKAFSYTDNTVVYTVNPLGTALSVGGVGSIATDSNDLVTVVTKGGTYGAATNREAVAIYIQKKNPTAPTYTLTLTGNDNFAYTVNADATVYAASGTKAVSASDVVTISGYTYGCTTYTVTNVTVASGTCNLVNNGNGTWTVKNVTAATNLNIAVTSRTASVVSVNPSTYTITITTDNGAASTIDAIITELMANGYARSEITVGYDGTTYTVSTSQNGVTITWNVI